MLITLMDEHQNQDTVKERNGSCGAYNYQSDQFGDVEPGLLD